jgi:dipeptidyl aminopeptidase/acylaminoacyl peptidase
MLKFAGIIAALCFFLPARSQQKSPGLTVEKIMRDPRWIGTSPSNISWGNDDQVLYFNWNPDGNPGDSLYSISVANKTPVKVSALKTRELSATGTFIYNATRTHYIYSQDGDIYIKDIKTNKTRQITQTADNEGNPHFSFNDNKVAFTRNQNLYVWDIVTGETIQLTNLRVGADQSSRSSTPALTAQEQWLKNDQLRYFEVLKERKQKREETENYNKSIRQKELRNIFIEDKSLQGLMASPDGRFITYRLFKPAAGVKNTIVPSYVTESGFTTDIPARSKVGGAQGSSELFMYDRLRDTVIAIRIDSTLAGIRDLPDYLKDYPKELERRKKNNTLRAVNFGNLSWSPRGTHAVLEVRSQDNKDRWILLIDTATTKPRLLDRQRDEAWIGGPGIGFFGGTGWVDDNTFWFQSEETGYSHLYTINVTGGAKKALTSGKFEVQRAQLSRDKKMFYITTNEVHPGEQHFYRIPVTGGKMEKITSMTGANQVALSPDEKWIGILHSYSNKPWELYMQENKAGAKPEQITNKAQSEEFKSYAWREPEVTTITAADGAQVYARMYKPANPHPNKPAVLFVHGAGYLQNAHKWWSSYFREYMFNNMLADNGYYVLDIDYRGSAGYGRDWRTGIYRWMGGKDLSDHVDAVNYLVKNHGVNPKNVGIYGGSYGGFITLMALFTEPDVFAAGAALRPVTDWAQYNHGYTSNILNEPVTDSIAYRKSSPLYFAEGLKGHLLMCHGMVDVNVHYQDAVKLAQRLIELGKDNWELASYPMEDHGFVEPSSWTDEYKRIFKLFEQQLKK